MQIYHYLYPSGVFHFETVQDSETYFWGISDFRHTFEQVILESVYTFEFFVVVVVAAAAAAGPTTTASINYTAQAKKKKKKKMPLRRLFWGVFLILKHTFMQYFLF